LGYQKLYDVTQEAIYQYSKAWNNLYRAAFEEKADKRQLQADALIYFQRGNGSFSLAGVLLEKITE
ncbi:MAG: hypothetical protein JW869_06255, partial [Candidatus Omnitrophica bacterium]|nr:hypothetical protein [Candidatus Omnitrophota bacterium]